MFWKRNHHTHELYTGLDDYSLPCVLILQETFSVSMPSSGTKFLSNKTLDSIHNLKCPHNSFSSIFVPDKQSSQSGMDYMKTQSRQIPYRKLLEKKKVPGLKKLLTEHLFPNFKLHFQIHTLSSTVLDAILYQLSQEYKHNMTLQGTDGKIHNKFALSAVTSPSIRTDTHLQKGGFNNNF